MESTAMHRRISHLAGHVLICGFGRFGRVVAEELAEQNTAIVVIESDPAKESELLRSGLPHLIGSALDDSVLEEAGIRHAKAIVIATASDPDNLYVVLSAREKNPAIRIHARAESDAGLRRLQLAGADQVISAYQRGGMRIAASILRPSVVDFLELSTPGRGPEVELEEIRVVAGSSACGLRIEDLERRCGRVRIVAVKRDNEPIALVPERESIIQAGDYLVVIGEHQSLKQLTSPDLTMASTPA